MGATGLLLVAIGAILYWGTSAELAGTDVDVIGIILMVVGGVGFLTWLVRGSFTSTRTERVTHPDGDEIVERHTSTM